MVRSERDRLRANACKATSTIAAKLHVAVAFAEALVTSDSILAVPEDS